jgi:hypothetical protein
LVKTLPNDMLRLVGEMLASSLYREDKYDERYTSRRNVMAAEDWTEFEAAEVEDRPALNRDLPQVPPVGLEAKGLDDSIRRVVGRFQHRFKRNPDMFTSEFLHFE